MQLEQLYTSFESLSAEEQLAFIERYRLKRDTDMVSVVDFAIKKSKKKKTTKKKVKKSKIKFNTDQLELFEKLGLNAKDF